MKKNLLIHPIRLQIALAILNKNNNPTTTAMLLQDMKDVPQATLYRHLQIMTKNNILKVVKEIKARGASEKYYILDVEMLHVEAKSWNEMSIKERLQYLSFYQLALINQYQIHLSNLKDAEDKSTFSMVKFALTDTEYANFEQSLNDLFQKYYELSSKNDSYNIPSKTIAVTIIPD